MSSANAEPLRPVASALGALISVLAFGIITAVAVLTARGQRFDDGALQTVWAGRDAELKLLSVLGRVSIGGVLLLTTGCVIAALLRGRIDLAVAAVVVIGGANVSSQLIKQVLLERPDFGHGTLNSLPSGHATVVASGAAAMILVSPGPVRQLLALAGSFAVTLTGASTVVAAWHRPSDVVASMVLTFGWLCLACVGLRGWRRLAFAEVGCAVVGASAAGLAMVAIGVRPLRGWSGFFEAGLVLGVIAAAAALFVMAICAVVPRGRDRTLSVGVSRPATFDRIGT